VTNDKLKVRRVVATLDAAAIPEQVLDTAAVLASALHAELVGLYVEDERLLRVAGLPFAQEFGLVTAHARQIAVVDVERALRSQAERRRHPNGQMEARGEYVMGSREGEWTDWRNDGTLMEAASGLYRNDQRVRKNQ
jgi:hypothetical protein